MKKWFWFFYTPAPVINPTICCAIAGSTSCASTKPVSTIEIPLNGYFEGPGNDMRPRNVSAICDPPVNCSSPGICLCTSRNDCFTIKGYPEIDRFGFVEDHNRGPRDFYTESGSSSFFPLGFKGSTKLSRFCDRIIDLSVIIPSFHPSPPKRPKPHPPAR
jgi:hypothetical protein